MKRTKGPARSSEAYELSLSDLLAPSMKIVFDGEKSKLVRLPPSDKYVAALRREGKRVPEYKTPAPDPVDASGWGPETQILYVKLAAREGDWRSLKGTKPTPKMQDLFVRARAKYLAWKHRHQNDPIEIIPAVDATAFERREIFYPEIDMSKTCPSCKMRRMEPNRSVCGNCFEFGYGQ